MVPVQALVLRAGLWFFCVASVGAIIGFAWEGAVHQAEASRREQLQARADEDMSAGSPSRTPEEEAVLSRALPHFPPYPRAKGRPEVLAADYLGPGVPMAVAWFSTGDTPDAVLEHYQATLVEQGLPVLARRYGPNGGYVGYWSPRSGAVHLVSVLAQGGETLVFVSSGEMEPLLSGRAAVPSWLPLPEGAQSPVVLTFRMEGTTYYTVSGRIPEGVLADVGTAYAAGLRTRGWEAEDARAVGEREVGFEVGHEALRGQVLLRQGALQADVEFHLSLMERGAAPAMEARRE
jgi:hypothetical protein